MLSVLYDRKTGAVLSKEWKEPETVLQRSKEHGATSFLAKMIADSMIVEERSKTEAPKENK